MVGWPARELKKNRRNHAKPRGRDVPAKPQTIPRSNWVKKSHFKRNMGVLALVIFIVVVGFYSLAQSSSGASAQPLQVYSSAWKTAPLTDAVTGQNMNLGQFSGKTIVLQFMATYCQYCLAEGRQLVSVQQSLSGNSQAWDQVVIVSADVDPNENLSQLKQYVQQNHFGAPNSTPPWYYVKDTTGQLLQSIAGSVSFGSFIARTQCTS